MAYIRKTASGYRAEIEIKGVRKSKSFDTKREAQIWAASEETQINQSASLAPRSKYTLRQALEKYRDEICQRNQGAAWEQIRINAFLEHSDWLPLDKKIGDVDTDDFSRFRDERLKTVKPGTVLREFGILSGMMGVVRKEWKWITENPVADVKKPQEPPSRDRLITRSEIKGMLRECGYSPQKRVRSLTEAIAVFFLLALRTGMRAGEIASLKWADIHPRHVVIEFDKLGRRKGLGRDVPLSKKAVRVLEKMRGFDTTSVFALQTQTLDARFRDIRESAGLTIRDKEGKIDKVRTFTFHDTRHTAATWMAGKFKNNKDVSAQQALLDLCKIFGWSDMKRALTYYNPKPEDMANRLD